VGCCRPFVKQDSVLACTFCLQGFNQVSPCGTLYHPKCIQAGPPFTSRRNKSAGLCFPLVTEWPNFICELCTVRAVLGRELGHPGDRWLLQLERVRLLDTAHNWAPGTLSGYQTNLRTIRKFEGNHPGLHILTAHRLLEPPHSPDIPTMWMELHASVQQLAPRGRLKARTPAHVTVRQLRSAVSHFHTLDQLAAFPGTTYFSDKRKHVVGGCRPTDCASYSLFERGFSSRIGTDSVPTTSLLGRHVVALDTWMTRHIYTSISPYLRTEWARARVVNLISWLGWTRSGETFDLRWEDISCIPPEDGEQHDLPPNCGAVFLRLQPETKGSRTSNVDIVIAHTTVSGLSLGTALNQLYNLLPHPPLATDFVFQGRQRWTSLYYKTNFLHPGLHHLRNHGDPFLSTFDTQGSHSIESKYWSLHCYRRGARTHCQRAQPSGPHKKATHAQVYEHARWRMKRANEDIGTQYREWTLRDRLAITLHCH
jgi:hypothetical protein